MAGNKNFGPIPNLDFRTLCRKNKLVIDEDCNLKNKNMKSLNDVYVKGDIILKGEFAESGLGDTIFNSVLHNPNDEHTRIAYIGNVNNDTIISPIELEYFDKSTVNIISQPCDGIISSPDPITGNISYTAIEELDNHVDLFQYSIQDNCGYKSKITQYICRSEATPFINNKCTNGDTNMFTVDVPACTVAGEGIGKTIDPSSVVVTRVEEPIMPPVVNETIKFTGWDAFQYSPVFNPPLGEADWALSSSDEIAMQNNNAQPSTQLVSPNLSLYDWEVVMDATPTGVDDDYVGFTVGFNVGDETNPNADYLIVFWQGSVGTKIYRQQGVPTFGMSGFPTNWTLITSGSEYGSTTFVNDETHTWTFRYCGGNLLVYIDGDLDFDLPWSFPNGTNFGLWCLSQSVTYRNGLRTTNVCCPTTSLIPDYMWTNSGNVNVTVNSSGLLTIDTIIKPRAVRVGVKISNIAENESPEALFYFGFYGPNIELLYATQGSYLPGSLYLIKLNSDYDTIEEVTLIGPLLDDDDNEYTITGIAFHPSTGVLYGVSGRASPTNGNSLVTIDINTGRVTVIGVLLDDINSAQTTIADISFLSNEILVGWAERGREPDSLAIIDITTGLVTMRSDSGLGTYGSGISANSSDILYFAGDGDTGYLRTIDFGTGQPTDIGILNGTVNNSVGALTFNGLDMLFGTVLGNFNPDLRDAKLVRIDTVPNMGTNNMTDVVGSIPQAIDGLAFRKVLQSEIYAPRITLLVPDTAEGVDGNAEVRVSLTRPSTFTIDVGYTLGGTANTDQYTITPPSPITFNPSETEKIIYIQAIEDNIPEPDQTVDITLSSIMGDPQFMLLAPIFNTVTVNIINVDRFVYVRAHTSVAVENSIPGLFRIYLTTPCPETLTVTYNITGTAVNGVNYTLSPVVNQVIFAPSETVKDVTVNALNDGMSPTMETVILTLTSITQTPGPTTLYDISPIPTDQTATVTVTETIAGSFYLDGSQDCIFEVPSSIDFMLRNSPFTIEFYYYGEFPGAVPNDRLRMSPYHRFTFYNGVSRIGVDNYSQWYAEPGTGVDQFGISTFAQGGFGAGGGYGIYNSAASFVQGKNRWQHFAYTYDGVSRARWFINGYKFFDSTQVSSYYKPNDQTGSGFTIGNSGYGDGFRGYICQFRVVKSILYINDFIPPSNGYSPNAPNTILFLGPNNTVNPFVDMSGNNHNGVEINGPCVVHSTFLPFPFTRAFPPYVPPGP